MTEPEGTLSDAWSLLSPSAAGPGIDTHKIGMEVDAGAVRVGLDGFGSRHLLVPLSGRSIASDERSGGVVLVGQELSIDGRKQLFADLVCTRPELNDVFGALAADICGSLRRTGGDPPTIISNALVRWRELLGRAQATANFGRASMVGLHGELIVLERALVETGPSVLLAWTGPQRLHHDFRNGAAAVEVKTTAAREGLRIEVHGLEQLDSSADVHLTLVVVKLIEDPAGDSLPEVVERLLGQVGDRTLLLERIQGSGYVHGVTKPPEQAAHWPRFALSDIHMWPVDENFPAIRRDSLPPAAPAALEQLRYTINLAGAGEPLPPPEAAATLRALGDGA